MSTVFRVGVLVVLGLLFISIGVFLIGDKEDLFGSTYVLKAGFQNVDGLNNGAEVRVGGIHEGTVKQILLPSQPDGKVTVVMNVRSSTRGTIKKDSVASIKTEGLLGDRYVDISFGSVKATALNNGDSIASKMPEDIADQAEAIADQAKSGIAAFRDDAQALQHNFLLRGYFAKRGYNDASQLTKHSISHLPAGQPLNKLDYDPGDIFAKSDSAKLKNHKPLDEAGRLLEGTEFGLAVIVSSEAKGDTDQDRLLTEARAKVIRDYLVQNFKFDDTRLKTLGRGKTNGPSKSAGLAIFIYSGDTSPSRREKQVAQSSSLSNP